MIKFIHKHIEARVALLLSVPWLIIRTPRTIQYGLTGDYPLWMGMLDLLVITAYVLIARIAKKHRWYD